MRACELATPRSTLPSVATSQGDDQPHGFGREKCCTRRLLVMLALIRNHSFLMTGLPFECLPPRLANLSEKILWRICSRSVSFRTAKLNFIYSMAACATRRKINIRPDADRHVRYSVVCYVLAIRDRHNGYSAKTPF